MAQTLTIWCNAELREDAKKELEVGCSGHRLIMATQPTSNLASGAPSPELELAVIAFGQPNPEQVIELQSLRWVHITSAGYTRYDRSDVQKALESRDARLTNSSSVYDEPCAQHLLAFMLAHARRLPEAVTGQVTRQSWIYDELRPISRVLEDETVLILGYGAIARRLCELLKPFSLNLIAIRRRVRGDELITVREEKDIDALLPTADHIVSTLPASPTTVQLMNADRFSLVKPGATFYNVGRGTTVDQTALIQVLTSARLSAAYPRRNRSRTSPLRPSFVDRAQLLDHPPCGGRKAKRTHPPGPPFSEKPKSISRWSIIARHRLLNDHVISFAKIVKADSATWQACRASCRLATGVKSG